jgi:hypothetical protein
MNRFSIAYAGSAIGVCGEERVNRAGRNCVSGVGRFVYSFFDLNVQVESTTGGTGITGKSKTKHPSDPRVPRGLLFLNTQVKNALIALSVALSD